MDLVYLDYNCFQRSFDDPSQDRIRAEALACEGIFARAEAERLRLVWSFMHADECELCPFPDRRVESLRLSRLCEVRVGPDDGIRRVAESLARRAGLRAKDALHLACALSAGAGYFVTCDDQVLRRTGALNLGVEVVSPVEYLQTRVSHD